MGESQGRIGPHRSLPRRGAAMTAGTPAGTARTAATAGRVSRLDPARTALRRAVRVTLAGCVAFYALRYGLGDANSAVYALFTTIALGALSDVQGTPADRTRTYLVALLAGAVLVTAGTLAAISTAVAAAGMLVVGFVVAYAGVGGPRVAGVANGLQLFYVLPCFPPFAPDTLDQRLAGLAIGGLLLVAADRLVLPAPAPPPPGSRLAAAADRIAAYASALRPALQQAGITPGPDTDAARRAALDVAVRLRLTEIPVAQRPLGPGVRDRALLAAGAATRVTAGRLAALADLVTAPGHIAHPYTADLVHEAGTVFAAIAEAVCAGRPAPIDTSGLESALERYGRARHVRVYTSVTLRAGLIAAGVAEHARVAALGTGAFLGAPPPDPAVTPLALWFLHARWPALVGGRLRAHLTPRSVYLQNAVRLAVGLAVARVVAGALDLSHGFWVLLATLSLMRTSAIAGRAVLPQAFLGTAGGAVAAAGLLSLVGGHTDVYAWTLPLVMVVAFAAGPVLGVGAGQAGFTVVVAMLFAQVAPEDWRLAEVRLTDVLVGGLIGALIGAAVWPRGGGGEVRRAAADGLRSGAAAIRGTIGLLARGTAVSPSDLGSPDDLGRRAALFDDAYTQFRTEPAGAPGPDWLRVLAMVHRIDNYAAVLTARYPGGAPLPPDAAAALESAARAVAAAVAAAGDAVGAGEPPSAGAGAALRHLLDSAPPPAVRADREAALRLTDGWNWLHALADDLDELAQACAPSPRPRPDRAPAEPDA